MTTPEGEPSSSDRPDRVNEALRGWYAAFNELGRQFGLHAGMHSSDAAALIQITTAEDRGSPLTQTELARRIGLSPPATSSLLTRLEADGHVERQRTHADRRIVTVRSTRAVHDEIQDFFRAVSDDLDALASRYPDETLDRLTALVTDMTAVLDRHLARMISDRS